MATMQVGISPRNQAAGGGRAGGQPSTPLYGPVGAFALPGGQEFELPTLSRGALEREGFSVIERRQLSLLAVVGGFHLSGPAFEPIISPTVAALTALAPELIVPSHCTGWRAQRALAAALPAAWVQASVGTSYTRGAARDDGQRN